LKRYICYIADLFFQETSGESEVILSEG